MHPAISHLAKSRAADLQHQAQRDALARAAAQVPSHQAQPGRQRIPVGLRRARVQRRFGAQLWALLHAQTLLDGATTDRY